MHTFPGRPLGLLLACVFVGANSFAEPVPVRHPQGSMHGFLEVRTLDNARIASGDVTQSVHGDQLSCHILLHFRDGSIDDETTVYSQRDRFRLISDHHIQHGPSFPKPIDVSIHAATGQITSHTEDGKTREDHLDLPTDVSNGLPPVLLMNIPRSAPETRLSYVAPTEKPRLIHLSVKPAGEVHFYAAGIRRKAIDYVIHVELGGIAGVVAPLVGKQPADMHVWILSDSMPTFIREEGQLYEGGPLWRIEQVSPIFSGKSAFLKSEPRGTNDGH